MHFHIYRDQVGEYRWRLKAKNGKIITAFLFPLISPERSPALPLFIFGQDAENGLCHVMCRWYIVQ